MAHREVFGRQPGNGSLENQRMRSLLTGLTEKKPARLCIRYQGSLSPGAIVGHSFAMFEKDEQPGNWYLFVRTYQHE